MTSIGTARIKGVTGTETTTKYKARVDIPVNIDNQGVLASRKELEVVGMLQYMETNILLGMDFLSAFHITMHGNIFILSI
ncbi:MAG: hypothetical protein OXC62_12945 [Aestuariivita sp.]|nr:hypothetical protein [Aestuariivita sp.]